MRNFQRLASLLAALWFSLTLASSPVSNVHVTFRGATYDINNVATVKDVQQQMKQTAANVASDPTILFQGKRLEPSDILRQVGVEDGAQLQVEEETQQSPLASSSSTTTTTNPTDPNFDMDAFLKSMGVEKDQMDDFLKSMGASPGGGAGGDGKVPSMKESMEMMGNMMNSPIFETYINDPEKLEESRQMILSNSFLKQMMMAMPGMQQLLEDKDAWREAMQAAASLYKNMDPALLQSMMSNPGMGGSGGPSGGLFDGTFDPKSTNLATASLDELDEGDD